MDLLFVYIGIDVLAYGTGQTVNIAYCKASYRFKVTAGCSLYTDSGDASVNCDCCSRFGIENKVEIVLGIGNEDTVAGTVYFNVGRQGRVFDVNPCFDLGFRTGGITLFPVAVADVHRYVTSASVHMDGVDRVASDGGG